MSFGRPEPGWVPTCPVGQKWVDGLRRCVYVGSPDDPDTHKNDIVVPPDPLDRIMRDKYVYDAIYAWLTHYVADWFHQLYGHLVLFGRKRIEFNFPDPTTGLPYTDYFEAACDDKAVTLSAGQYYIEWKANPYRAARDLGFWFGFAPRLNENEIPKE